MCLPFETKRFHIMRRDVFQAMADPTRREIISILSERESNLNDLIGHFQISRPGVVKHVRILEECGLVDIEKRGRERYCHAKLDNLGEIALWVHQYRRFWNTRLDRLEGLLKEDETDS
jgi:DNA-binding transcriptional ArsR family regulator